MIIMWLMAHENSAVIIGPHPLSNRFRKISRDDSTLFTLGGIERMLFLSTGQWSIIKENLKNTIFLALHHHPNAKYFLLIEINSDQHAN